MNDIKQFEAGLVYDELGSFGRAHVERLILELRALYAKYEVSTTRDFIGADPEPEDLKIAVDLMRAIKSICDRGELSGELLERAYEEAEDLFGSNFFGMRDVRAAFSVTGGELLTFSDAQREQIMRALVKKFNEPDVAEFIEKIRFGEVNASEYLLILRLGKLDDGTPLTIDHMRQKLAQDMMNEDLPVPSADTGEDEYYYTKDVCTVEPCWVIVSKDMLAGSTRLDVDGQEFYIGDWAKEMGFDPEKISFRSAVDVAYDYVVLVRSHVDPRELDLWGRFERTSSMKFGRVLSAGSLSQGAITYSNVFNDRARATIGARFQR